MLQSKNAVRYKGRFLGTDNGPANWESKYDSTMYVAFKPVLSFDKTQTTGSYLSSIKEICVIFLQSTMNIQFSRILEWCPSLIPHFLPFIQFLFTVLFILFSVFIRSSVLSIYVRNIIFQLKVENSKNFKKIKLQWIASAMFFSLFPPIVLSIFRFYKLLFPVHSFCIHQTTDRSIRLIYI